jgi:hypothetical protein
MTYTATAHHGETQELLETTDRELANHGFSVIDGYEADELDDSAEALLAQFDNAPAQEIPDGLLDELADVA